MMMAKTREQLYRLIDDLPESELNSARRYLEFLRLTGDYPDALAGAPEEDEPLTRQEAEALAEAEAQVDRGELIPDDEFDLALARARRERRSGS